MTDDKGSAEVGGCRLILVQSVRNRTERYLIVLWPGTSSLNDSTKCRLIWRAAAATLKHGALLDDKGHVVKVRFNVR